jgi:hypothetical protein
MVRGQRHQLLTPGYEKRLGNDHKCNWFLVLKNFESFIDVLFLAGLEDNKSVTAGLRRTLDRCCDRFSSRVIRINKYRKCADGLVESLDKPGGNATGVTSLSATLDAKRYSLCTMRFRTEQGFVTGGMGSGRHFARRQSSGWNVRYGSKADIALVKSDVRFTPKSGHGSARS